MHNEYLINSKEQLLLSSVINDEYNSDIINALFEDLDIPTTNFYFLLLLAHFANSHKWNHVENNKRNWLHGILRQTQTRNTIILSQTKKLLDLFGASFILTCDLPMKLCHDPNTTRVIYTIKCLTTKDEFPKISKSTEQLNQNFPYEFSKISISSNPDSFGLEDIETFIYESTLGPIRIPIPEDTLIMLFYYYAQKLKDTPDKNIAFKAYYDAAVLLKECNAKKLEQRLSHAPAKNDIQKYLNPAINFCQTIYA